MKKVLFAALSLSTMAVLALASGNGMRAAAATPAPQLAPGCTVTCNGSPIPGNIRDCTASCRGTCDIICPVPNP
jgi:hypothetical protein